MPDTVRHLQGAESSIVVDQQIGADRFLRHQVESDDLTRRARRTSVEQPSRVTAAQLGQGHAEENFVIPTDVLPAPGVTFVEQTDRRTDDIGPLAREELAQATVAHRQGTPVCRLVPWPVSVNSPQLIPIEQDDVGMAFPQALDEKASGCALAGAGEARDPEDAPGDQEGHQAVNLSPEVLA
jgi:hypothetical protein